ncbi:hypothetical protein HAX54_048920 [Datura stramonium]|uniref:Uncharacterized protein n=1 Tax=Datura stramonium TaxID=4076 RepID=A0ABS8WPM2_DATST|nr:hypothetical protein [Datura stramonium]
MLHKVLQNEDKEDATLRSMMEMPHNTLFSITTWSGRNLQSELDKHIGGRIIDEDEANHDDIVEIEELVVGKSNEEMIEEKLVDMP